MSATAETTTDLAPDLAEAERLLQQGFKLVRLHNHQKRPVGEDWNHRPVQSIDPEATGYGLPLAVNGLCSIDPDHYAMARAGLAAWGFDLDELLAAGVRTVSTRAGSGGRAAFQADPEGMAGWRTFRVFDQDGNSTTVLELRAKSANLQDVVPGLLYTDQPTGEVCTQRYAGEARFDDAPAVPDAFAREWRLMATDDDYFRERARQFSEAIIAAGFQVNGQRPKHKTPMGTGEDLAFPAKGYRGPFNRQHSVEDIISGHGYTQAGERWTHPGATGSPGIRPIPGRDGLWQSDHGGDPLHGTFDAWAAHVVLNHDGDVDAAIAEQNSQAEASGGESTQGSGDQTDELPEPVDMFGNLEPAPFPVECLPDVIGDFARDQSALMGVDPGVMGMAALVVAASVTDDAIEIQPKRHDYTWTESARLWFAAVGPPSAKKSPALAKVMKPANAIDAEWRKESEKKRKAHERKVKKLQKESPDEPPPPPPIYKRLVFGDTTVEKLASVMAECEPRGMLVFRDELTGWLSSMDAYKNGGGKDRADWLETYNGGPNSIDRVQRGSTIVENWSACVFGGIQPSVIHQYAGNTNHDGMIQRFIMLHVRDAQRGEDRAPDQELYYAYRSVIFHLSGIEPSGAPVQLEEGAHEVREALWDRLHRVTQSHPNPFLTAALGKWEGLFARLLLTFHVVDCASDGVHPCNRNVTAANAQRVSDLMWHCLLPHAIRFYQDLDDIEDKARVVAGLILGRSWERFTVKRDLDRYLRVSRKWKPWQLDETMQRLQSFGWILPEGTKLNERGRPAAYAVNPKVHTGFHEVAEKERQRREEVSQLMQEIRK